MKKILFAVCLALAVVMLVTPAYAEELWDFHLRGVDEGLAAGALPPPGFYFINNFYFVPNFIGYGSAVSQSLPRGEGQSFTSLGSYIDVPVLMWVPSTCKFLGADYAAAIAQPFDYTNLRIKNSGPAIDGATLNSFNGGAQWGAYNTILVPYILSWKIPCDFRVKTAFSVGFDDATTSPANRVTFTTVSGNKSALRQQPDGGIYAESGNGYYTFTPEIGISWLHAGWNISAELFYTVATKDTGTNYQSADEFAADYTVSYTCGKWTFGVGAAQQVQTGNDSFDNGDGTGYHTQPNTRAMNYSMGPLIGYNFGPCSLMFIYDFPLKTENDVGGEWCNLRLVIPLGNLGL